MSTTSFDVLLRVRDLRESSAANLLKNRAAAYAETQEDVRRKQEGLKTYRTWRIEEESNLFRQITNRRVTVRGLAELKGQFHSLREKEMILEESAAQAETNRQTAQEALNEAKTAYFVSVRQRKKLDGYEAILREAMRRESERLEEVEMEIFQHSRIRILMEDPHELA
ncbi:type III secretion system stalk subunit SctO [Desulfatiglans anilini]|uniref:type III secretion system stalk subunit SctO n=1 Tax=Desulfatiglans anilini TaxID=90728 RepID=UPI00048976CE|nr:YscO family type III secretion system apparatus protein [Desulfatiglans anilini]